MGIKDMVNYWNEKVLHEELTNDLLDEEPEDAGKNHSQSSLWSDIIFVPEGQERDSLTNWNFWDKFGDTWKYELEDFEDVHTTINSAIHFDTDIQEVFWKISLEYPLNRKEPSLLDLLRNLPVWDSPDIFLDSTEDFDMRYQRTKSTKKAIWNDSHKFGKPWKIPNGDGTEYPPKQVCVMKVFWKICLNKKLSEKEPSHASIVLNLPVSEWPGVCTDNWTNLQDEKYKPHDSELEDPVDIFNEFKDVFYQEERVPLKKKIKVKRNRNTSATDDWLHCEKFGKQWANPSEDEERKYFSSFKQKKTNDVDVPKLFWEIALDERCCRKDMNHAELTTNFPAWFGPDVFEDCWDSPDILESKVIDQKKNKHKDPLNIFKTWRKIFSDFFNFPKKKKIKTKNISNNEDLYKDWFVNVLNEKKIKEKITAGRYLHFTYRVYKQED